MKNKGRPKKVLKKLDGVRRGFKKQLKQLPKKAKINNSITKIGIAASNKL